MTLDFPPTEWLSDPRGVEVLDAAEIESQIAAAEGYLARLRKLRDSPRNSIAQTSSDRTLHLRPWQEDALEDWRRQKYHGVVQPLRALERHGSASPRLRQPNAWVCARSSSSRPVCW